MNTAPGNRKRRKKGKVTRKREKRQETRAVFTKFHFLRNLRMVLIKGYVTMAGQAQTLELTRHTGK